MAEQSDHAILLRIDPWIFRLEGLNLFEKMLLNYVYGWSIQHRCCFSSDEWLAYKFGYPAQDVYTTLNLLQMKGFIKINRAFRGGARSLTFIFDDVPDPCTGIEGPEDVFNLDA